MKINNCRLCDATLSEPIINLGKSPLANEFLSEKTEQELFSLEVCVCTECKHYQLNESVEPERLFRHYVYVAGTSPVNVQHFKDYADKLSTNLNKGDKVLDIASNDGTLLKHFKNLGMQVLGIDPAKNIAEIANNNGIETIPEFFSEKYADIILDKYGKFNLITANNVFAHLDELTGFAKGVKTLLADNGTFTFEVSYFLDVCNYNLIDTIYHEHSSYWTILPMLIFFPKYGLEVYNVEKINNHGGSIRVYVTHHNSELIGVGFHDLIQDEVSNLETYISSVNDKIVKLKADLNKILVDNKDKSIVIYGAPAKSTTLLYALDIDESLIKYAVDDNPLKQNTYSPGKHIPVYSPGKIYEDKPDYILILAWNFDASIVQKCKQDGYKGKFIIPLPELKVI